MTPLRACLQSAAASIILALAIANAAHAEPREQQLRLTPSDIAAMAKGGAGAGTSGASGIQSTVLLGDPSVAGPYTIALRVPPHTKIAAHTHRDDRAATVVSGMWLFGYGSSADEAQLKVLGPGSFYTEPADTPHFAVTRDEPVTVYITGFGPTDTHYTDTTADPRRP
jgi:quercetin dioxygenase-like cupin family protein